MTLANNPVPASGSQADDDERWTLSFKLNGQPVETEVHPLDTLLEVLRDRLRLTGTKGACLEGECGSCTVLIDGVPMNSCLVLAPQAQGAEVVSVEGLANGDELDRVQQAFVDKGAVQCGYCTPGLVIATKAFLETHPDPKPEEVRKGLEGNICRCTGYMKVIDAVLDAARSKPGCKGGCHDHA